MKFWQCLSTLIITILISACATTSNDKFSYTTEKRPLNSDFELAMSLLNRPVPQDQQFMLAFAQQQENQWGSMHYVSIYGDKKSSPITARNTWLGSHINNDINAKFIVGDHAD